MDLITFLVALAIFVSWGVGSFLAKLAADKIGVKSVFWDLIGYFIAIFIYSLFFLKLKNILEGEKVGVVLAILAGAIGALGAVGFYFLLTRAEASRVVPLTSLYPGITALLAILFLHESITSVKLLGIAFSLIAIYFLSK